MSSTRRRPLRAYLRMSALRQSLVLAVSLLVLQIIGAIVAEIIISRSFGRFIENELAKRFTVIAASIEADGYRPADYLDREIEVTFFQADPASAAAAPEGIFELRGAFDGDRWEDWWEEDDRDGHEKFWFYFAGEAAGSVLVIGTNLETPSAVRALIPGTFLLVGFVISLLAVATGLAISLRAQRRINRMRAVLNRVAAGNLESRIKTVKSRDDLDDLAQSIDQTVERLEVLFNQSRNMAVNIAHDLKTPLARLRLRLENALSLEGDESKDNVEVALRQADHVIAVFEAFLRIARLESGNVRKRFATVKLAELAEEVASSFGPVVEDAGHRFEVSVSGEATVEGDAILLTQMLTNLIENAMRHTPKGSLITLIATERELGVADNGPGIPEESYDEVVKPSVRLETSRTTPGAGLGLALVKAIADAHDAELILTDNPSAPERGLYVRAVFD